MSLSTHVLDTARGLPAPDIALRLEKECGTEWQLCGEARTDADGRARDFAPALQEGATYRLTFEVAPYFQALGEPVFYPLVQITFAPQSALHHHIPLLLCPFGYSTYRGS